MLLVQFVSVRLVNKLVATKISIDLQFIYFTSFLVIKRKARHIVAALKSQDVANMNPKAVVAGE